MPTSSPLSEFAQNPPAYLPPPAGASVVDDRRFHLLVSADGGYASVCRLRTPDVAPVLREVRERAPHARVVWITDGSAEAELRTLGCRDQDAPLSSYVTALATDVAPPPVEGIEVRRVETYAEFLVALEVSAAGWQTTFTDDPEAVWQRHCDRPGGDWVAFLDGDPVAYAGAIAGPRGLFLTGGVTRPEARGRGAYRALVRARWDEAVRRGTPGLVVHAEEASRRVLEAIGFRRVGPVVELVLDPSTLG
ncbi:MAG: GNAT family N-acetyltransferase [Gaiellaceae bacterium]